MLCEIVVICSCIAFAIHYNNVSCILGLCLIKLVSAIRLDWISAHDAFNFCTSHVRAFFMHTFSLFIPILSCVIFLFFLSLSLS